MTGENDKPDAADRRPEMDTKSETRMTKRSLASLVLKLLGVYLLAQLAVAAQYLVSFLQRVGGGYGSLLPELGWLLLCVAIWLVPPVVLLLYADRFAVRLVRQDEPVGELKPWTADDVLKVVVMCLGIAMVVSALPQIAGLGASAFQSWDVHVQDPAWVISFRRSLISTGIRLGIEVLLGLYLAVSPGKIVALVRLLRRPGSTDSEVNGGSGQPGEGSDSNTDRQSPPVEGGRE